MTGYPSDPAMFAQLTPEENRILCMHLTSGWYKQAAVYPTLSEPWRETEALLIDPGVSPDERSKLPKGGLSRIASGSSRRMCRHIRAGRVI